MIYTSFDVINLIFINILKVKAIQIVEKHSFSISQK
jgi:hypothetical protein